MRGKGLLFDAEEEMGNISPPPVGLYRHGGSKNLVVSSFIHRD